MPRRLRGWFRGVRSPKVRAVLGRGRDLVERRLVGRRLGATELAMHDELRRDPGIDAVVDACVDWLRTAQDLSASNDDGVAAYYSLVTGWSASYPETTGYIVPTLLARSRVGGDRDVRCRARRMLDWLVRIQLPEGGFQGGHADADPIVPVTFNTGQIVLGLVAGHREFQCYRDALVRAADWLVATQDADGCWRSHPSPFAAPGDKVYDTHVAWGLIEADGIVTGRYRASALANVYWALAHQRDNGFLDNCCLDDLRRPLTHTLGYAMRGMLEVYGATGDEAALDAARLAAAGLLGCLGNDGFLPGRVDPAWRPATDWSCLVGACQVAHCWLELYRITGEERFLDAGRRANAFVRRTVDVSGPPEIRGGVKGSHPLAADYQRFRYVSWAAKFCIDSNLLEAAILA